MNSAQNNNPVCCKYSHKYLDTSHGLIVINDLGTKCKETIFANCKTRYKHLPGRTENVHQNFLQLLRNHQGLVHAEGLDKFIKFDYFIASRTHDFQACSVVLNYYVTAFFLY
jgi:hypothetical protein